MTDREMMQNTVIQDLHSSSIVLQELASSSTRTQTLVEWSETISSRIEGGGCLFLAGNGGSFAEAQHLAAEFTGKMGRRRPPLPAVALGTNSSSMSAIGNDYTFDDIFAREYVALRNSPSVVLLMTTSGNSENLRVLADAAIELGDSVFVLVGGDGGVIAQLVDECLTVPSSRTERIQEAHLALGHILCSLVEHRLSDSYFEWEDVQ